MTTDLLKSNQGTAPVVSPQSQGTRESLSTPENPAAKEFRKRHWTIDKAVEDGQVRAGEVDEEHQKFLEETEMVG